MSRVKQGEAKWLGVSALAILALSLIPVVGLLIASGQEPPLFSSPPLSGVTVTQLLLRTMALALCVSLISIICGSWLAWCNVQYRFPGHSLIEVAAILPLAIPSYLLAGVIREVMAPRGIIGSTLGLTESFSGFWPAVLVLSLSCTPYVHLLVRSALSNQSAELEQAARLLGADAWRGFWAVTMPTLRPAWAFSLVIVAFYTISDFGAVAVLDCEVLTWALYQNRHTPRDVVALGGLIVGVVLPTMALIRWIHGKGLEKASVGVGRKRKRRRPMGFSALLVLLGYTLVIVPGLLIPVFVIMGWVFSGLETGMQWHGFASQIAHTFYYTGLGAVLTLMAALLMAWFVGRHQGGRGLIEYGVYLTSGLPGILIAVGIFYILLGIKASGEGPVRSMTSVLEHTGIFLLLGYVMRFLSEGYAAIKPGVVALDRRIEDAARILGASTLRRFTKVSLPALGPSIAAGAVLLIVAIAKELPITLLLTPLGEQTLAYRIFDAQQEGALPESGVPALLLLVMVFGVQLALRKGDMRNG